MAKGGIIAGATLAIVIGAGTVGYFYAQTAIKKSIEAGIADMANHPSILNASSSVITVDLFGNTATVANLKVDMSVSDILTEQLGTPTDAVMGLRSDSTVLSGVWSLLGGGTSISSLDVTGLALNVKASQESDGDIVNVNVNGSVANSHSENVDISAFMAGTATPDSFMYTPMTLSTGQDFTFDTVITGQFTVNPDPGDPDAPQEPEVRKIPEVTARITWPTGTARDVTADGFGLMSYQDLNIAITLPEAEQPIPAITIGEIAMKDAKLLDNQVIKADFTVSDAVVHMDGAPDPELAMAMAMLGAEELNFNMRMNYDLDPDAQTFSLSPLQFGLKKVGSADIALELGAFPSIEEFKRLDGMTDQVQAEAALNEMFADVSLKRVALGYKDEGALKTLITMQALQVGGDVNILAEGYAQQAALIVKATHGADKAREVAEKIATFINNPTELRIGLSTSD
ncbi:hypothetical protein ACFL12_08460, partial [Pseudomonadota bacterium]